MNYKHPLKDAPGFKVSEKESSHQDKNPVKVEDEFEKYQTYYCYQWKVNHIQMHKKIVELEGEARML